MRTAGQGVGESGCVCGSGGAQGAGLLISRKAHGAHHRAPFEGNYCIVSGFWNKVLDQVGSAGIAAWSARQPHASMRLQVE